MSRHECKEEGANHELRVENGCYALFCHSRRGSQLIAWASEAERIARVLAGKTELPTYHEALGWEICRWGTRIPSRGSRLVLSFCPGLEEKNKEARLVRRVILETASQRGQMVPMWRGLKKALRNVDKNRRKYKLNLYGRDVLDIIRSLKEPGDHDYRAGSITANGYKYVLDVPAAFFARRGDGKIVVKVGLAPAHQNTPAGFVGPWARPWQGERRHEKRMFRQVLEWANLIKPDGKGDFLL